MYAITASTDGETLLHRTAELCNSYIATSIDVRGSEVLVGDALYSVTLLRINGNAIETVSTYHAPLWPVSIEFDGDSNAIVANVSPHAAFRTYS